MRRLKYFNSTSGFLNLGMLGTHGGRVGRGKAVNPKSKLHSLKHFAESEKPYWKQKSGQA